MQWQVTQTRPIALPTQPIYYTSPAPALPTYCTLCAHPASIPRVLNTACLYCAQLLSLSLPTPTPSLPIYPCMPLVPRFPMHHTPHTHLPIYYTHHTHYVSIPLPTPTLPICHAQLASVPLSFPFPHPVTHSLPFLAHSLSVPPPLSHPAHMSYPSGQCSLIHSLHPLW